MIGVPAIELAKHCVQSSAAAGFRPSGFQTLKDLGPMAFTMSQASLPVFETGLNALSAVLDKAAAFTAAKKVDPAVLLGWRLAPDMFALARRQQSKQRKGIAGREFGTV